MTKDKTVTMSRELIEKAAHRLSDLGQSHISEPMFEAILAAPVVERQEPFGFWRVPIGFPLQGMFILWDEESAQHIASASDVFDFKMLYTSPPAPVAEQHPIAYMRNEGTPNNLVQCSFTCPGAFGVYRGPQSFFSAMPAPVAASIIVDRKCPVCGDLKGHDGWVCGTKPPAPTASVAVDAAKAFAKGFNTLETIDGKYRIVMQFAGHDDAWDAYTELSQMTACLDKVKELNQ